MSIMDNTSNILLAFLGIGIDTKGYDPATYLDEENNVLARSPFSTLAVSRHLQLSSSDTVIIVCTKESMTSLQELKVALDLPQVRSVVMGKGWGWPGMLRLHDELESARGNRSAQLHLDISTGPRDAPSLFISLLTFLSTGESWTPGRICYSAPLSYDPDGHRQFKVHDLTLLAQVLELTNSARLLVDAGQAHRLSESLQSSMQTLFRGKGASDQPPSQDEKLQRKIGDTLQRLGLALRYTALKEIQNQCSWLRSLLGEVGELGPEFRFLFLPFERDFAPLWTGISEIPDWKQGPSVPLHLRCIEWYLDHGRFDQASLALSETMITLGVLCHNESCQWLNSNLRSGTRQTYNELKAQLIAKADIAPPQLRVIAELWNQITPQRNLLAHCAMNEESFKLGKNREEALRRQLSDLRDLQQSRESWASYLPDSAPAVDPGGVQE